MLSLPWCCRSHHRPKSSGASWQQTETSGTVSHN
jgi:hypothetical protein